jgi:hypothetical protein
VRRDLGLRSRWRRRGRGLVEVAKRMATATATRDGAVRRTRERWCLTLGLGVGGRGWVGGESELAILSKKAVVGTTPAVWLAGGEVGPRRGRSAGSEANPDV